MDIFDSPSTHAGRHWEPLPVRSVVQEKVGKSLSSYSKIGKEANEIFRKLLHSNNIRLNLRLVVFPGEGVHVMHAQDGNIFIPSGLYNKGKNLDEKAFIIAHEIAHWTLGDMRGSKVSEATFIGDHNDSECNADIKAQEYLKNAGFDPKSRLDIMSRFPIQKRRFCGDEPKSFYESLKE